MVIDAHHHLGQEEDYADKLIDTMAKLGVDKTVLAGYQHDRTGKLKR